MKTVIKRYTTEDDTFGCLLTVEHKKEEDHYVEVVCYRVTATEDEKDTDIPDDCKEMMFKGSIKWDGCSNFFFGPCAEDEHHVYMHFCEPKHAKNIGLMLVKAYEIAAELMEDKADSLAEWTA